MEMRVSLSGENPHKAAAFSGFAAVGLLRAEFLLREGLQSFRSPGMAAHVRSYVTATCQAFAGRPVWYRLADLWSDEAAVLTPSQDEPREQNPLLGHRGLRRALADPELFALEMDIITQVATEHQNLHLLFPFVSDAEEFAEAATFARHCGWPNRLGVMIETPAAILEAPRFVEEGACNFLVGLNDLSCLMLGRERGAAKMKEHRAVQAAIAMLREALGEGSKGGKKEWGIGGSLTPSLLSMAKAQGAGYATIHYAETPDLVPDFAAEPEELGLQRRIKQKTNAAKAAQRKL